MGDKKLYQMHWQFKDGHTEMCSQIGIDTNLSLSEQHEIFKKWAKATAQSHPLPDGAVWMWCEEDSIHFWMTTPDKE